MLESRIVAIVVAVTLVEIVEVTLLTAVSVKNWVAVTVFVVEAAER